MAKGQPIDGRHIRVEILLDGVPQDGAAQATNLTKRARYDQIETKLLGEPSPLIDHDHTGWEGTITFAKRSKSLEHLVNAYNRAKRMNLPVSLNIVEQITYRDQSSIMHTYPDVEMEFDMTGRRGSAVEVSIPWVTGKDRITIG